MGNIVVDVYGLFLCDNVYLIRSDAVSLQSDFSSYVAMLTLTHELPGMLSYTIYYKNVCKGFERDPVASPAAASGNRGWPSTFDILMYLAHW